MKKNEVTIVIDFKIYLYLFEPIIQYLLQKGVKVYLAASQDIMPEVKDILSGLEITFINLSEIKSKNKFRFYVHRMLLTLCTREDFSFQYKKKRQQTTKKAAGMQGILLRIARFTPKVANKKINGFLHKVNGVGLKNPFPTNKIMVGSLNASAELLTAKTQKVITVMESWDHPVKHPNGYCSHSIYTWNRSLSLDWIANQYEKNCFDFYPLKLRYPLQHRLVSRQESAKDKKVIMYAISSTARFSINVMTSLDLRIIEALIKATRRAGWTLRLKPRPNGTLGEFDHYAEHEHVEVLPINEHVANPANYYLDDKYNNKRFSDLDDVSVVVNSFSTFGLDAACYGVPVIQLDLRENKHFLDSYMVFDNYHLKTHVLQRENTFNVRNELLEDAIFDALSGSLEFARGYSEEIYQWLTQGRDLNSALNMLYMNEFTKGTHD